MVPILPAKSIKSYRQILWSKVQNSQANYTGLIGVVCVNVLHLIEWLTNRGKKRGKGGWGIPVLKNNQGKGLCLNMVPDGKRSVTISVCVCVTQFARGNRRQQCPDDYGRKKLFVRPLFPPMRSSHASSPQNGCGAAALSWREQLEHLLMCSKQTGLTHNLVVRCVWLPQLGSHVCTCRVTRRLIVIKWRSPV